MKARCLTCDVIVDCDESFIDASSDETEDMCDCPGGSRCAGDDCSIDAVIDDPRHGQAADINRSSEK